MAHDLVRALLLLSWVPAVRARTLRFGISLDLTSGACFYCHDALGGLLVWQRAVNEQDFLLPDGSRLRVQLDVRDDGGGKSSDANYEALAKVSDFLIGPANPEMDSNARAIVQNDNKLAMFWAMRDSGAYQMQPLANSTMETMDAGTMLAESLQALNNLTGLLQDWGNRRLSSLFHNCSEQSCQQRIDGHRLSMRSRGCSGRGCPERPLGDNPAATAWLATAQDQPPPGLGRRELRRWFLARGAPAGLASHFAAELLRAAPAWKRKRRRLEENSSGFVFDISLPQEQWADDLIERVSSETSGAHKFLFVWFYDFGDGGAESCPGYRDRVQEKSGTTWAYSYSLNFFTHLALNFRVIKYLNPDVLFLCGGEISLTVLIAAAKGFNVDTNAMAVDRPVGAIVAKALKGVNVNYLLEPLPLSPPVLDRRCDVFGSLQGFVDAFRRLYGVAPGMAALQTAAVGVSLTQAVRKARSLEVEAVAEWLWSGEVSAHFLGPITFTSDGDVSGINSSTRQFLPLPKGTFTPIQQYNHSLLAVVAPEVCGDDCGPQFRKQISFPAPDWLNKMAEVYPCALGCEWEGNRCAPCDVGKYRGGQDLQCRPCQDGDYSDAPGAAICLECPPGATCSAKDAKPVASDGHFRVQVAFRVFQYEDICDPDREQQVTVVRFERCQPPSVCGDSACVGDNQGMLCGQCGDGYSHSGPGMGGRRCGKCPHQMVVFLGFLAVVLTYAGLVLGLSYLGEKAAYTSGYLPCVLARALLHHVHLLGVAYEAMRADSADTITGLLLLPIDLLYRPLELIMFDCFKSNTNSDVSVQTYCQVYPLILPCALGANLGLHFVLWLLSILRNSTAAAAAHVLEEHTGGFRNGPSWDWCLEEEKARAFFNSHALGSHHSHSAGSEDSEDSERDEPKLHSRLFGPGRRFSQLHESFRFKVYRSSFTRTSLALVLLLYPVELRGLTLCLACERVAGEIRLRVDFDVLCESQDHWELVYFGRFFRTAFLFLVPCSLLLYLVIFAHRGFKVIALRRSCAVLFDGFKEGMVGWEVVIIFRTGCLIWATAMESLEERFALMLAVLVFFIVLIFFTQPFLPNYREGVNTFTLLSMVSIMVVLTTGRMNDADADDWYGMRVARVPILFATHVIHLSVAGFALLLATVSFALKVDYILQFGASISRWLLGFQSGFQWMRSLHIVEYVPVGDKHFIDVSSLSNLEKWYLARSLTRTVSACIDSGSNFRTWMVEKAIHEAFRRAMQARAAWVRQLYSEFGTSTWFLGGLFRVTLRSPDIRFAEETEEDRSNGVTVDELEIALQDVNEDILVHHPSIFCAPEQVEVHPSPPQPDTPTAEAKRAFTLHSIDLLQENNAGQTSVNSTNVVPRGSMESCESEDGGLDMLHEFSGETRQYKLETSNTEERDQLEATLHELEEEYEALQDQLDTLEMQSTPSGRFVSSRRGTGMSSPTRTRSRMLTGDTVRTQ